MAPRVFVSRVIPEIGLRKIQQHCDMDLWTDPLPPPREELLRRVQGCHGILTLLTDTVDAELLDRAGEQLVVVSNFAVGFNNIDIQAATQRGIAVGNTPGVLTDATADMAVALLLAAARRVVEGHRYTLSGQWKTWEPLGHIGQDLVGKTLGIVGMGRIGLATAKRLHRGWDMKVLYYDIRPNLQAEQELGAQRVDFDTLLENADFISIHTNLDDSTRGLFNREAFRKMKSTAVLVNTARGPIVVQEDLRWALEQGEIFAAGLDVTDPEPIDPQDPLLRLPNVVVAPHIASATVTSRNRMAEIAAQNLLAGLEGRPLVAWVNPEVEPHWRARKNASS